MVEPRYQLDMEMNDEGPVADLVVSSPGGKQVEE